jgi:hypothetical protein
MEFEVVKAKEKPRKVTDWSQLFLIWVMNSGPHERYTGIFILVEWAWLSNEEQQEYKLIQISGAYA